MISVNTDEGTYVPPPIEQKPIKNYENNEELRILFIVRDLTIARKNLQMILKALPIIKRKKRLFLVGKGAINAPTVESMGYINRDKIMDLMRKMDVLIVPSLYEKIGYVVLGAYAVGLPVITSDIPSFRTNFPASHFFSPYDPQELAHIINTFTREELKKLGRLSWDLVESRNRQALQRLSPIYKGIK
ncbi:MAG: glycosyltransferase [Conexivisphaerales archaeon]